MTMMHDAEDTMWWDDADRLRKLGERASKRFLATTPTARAK
jgi:hypothetical protein